MGQTLLSVLNRICCGYWTEMLHLLVLMPVSLSNLLDTYHIRVISERHSLNLFPFLFCIGLQVSAFGFIVCNLPSLPSWSIFTLASLCPSERTVRPYLLKHSPFSPHPTGQSRILNPLPPPPPRPNPPGCLQIINHPDTAFQFITLIPADITAATFLL
jgi:hypothetical protein